MTLKDIFDALASGELEQLYMGSASGDGIPAESQQRVVTSINLGLTALHRRFLLREGMVRVERVPGIQTYHLSSRYAVSNTESREPHLYLKDSPEAPFQDNVLRVERVHGPDGCEIPLNNERIPEGIITPTMTSLWVPGQQPAETLDVVFRADHPRIDISDGLTPPEQIQVSLPETHLEALLLFVAGRVHSPRGTDEHGNHDGTMYTRRYEAACQELEVQNFQKDPQLQNTRFEERGWV